MDVDHSTGFFYHETLDCVAPGLPGTSVKVSRYYHSSNDSSGAFGNNWDSPIFQRIAYDPTTELAVYYDGRMNSGDAYTALSTVLVGSIAVTSYEPPGSALHELVRETYFSSPLIYKFEMRDSRKRRLRFEYDRSIGSTDWYRIAAIVDDFGNQVTFSYGLHGRLGSISSSVGYQLDFTYITSGVNIGRVSAITDPQGRSISYEYDLNGDLVERLSYALALGGSRPTTTYSYDNDSKMLEVMLPEQNAPQISNVYDGSGRVIHQQTATAGSSITIDYAAFPTVSVVDATGTQIDYVSDTEGEDQVTKVHVHGAAGAQGLYSTHYDYGPIGELISSIGPDGVEYEYEYDSLSADPRERHNRLKRTVVPAGGGTALEEKWGYHSGTSLVAWYLSPSACISAGQGPHSDFAVEFTYSGDRMAEVKSPLLSVGALSGQRLTFSSEFDAHGRQTKFVSPSGIESVYSYADVGRMDIFPTSVVRDPAGEAIATQHAWTMDYHLDSATDNSGATWDWEYNAASLLTSATVSDSGKVYRKVLYDYDLRHQLIAVSTLRSDSPEEYTVEVYSYNDDGLLSSQVLADGDPEERTIFYEYYPDGLLRERRSASGAKIEYAYADSGELHSITRRDALGSDYFGLEYGYNTARQLSAITASDGTSTALEYDAFGRQARMVLPDGSERTNSYSPDGYVEALTNIDALGKILSKSVVELDEAGNTVLVRDSQLDGAGGVLGPAFDRLTTFSHDSDGTLAHASTPYGTSTTYTRNSFGAIASVVDGAGVGQRFEYDSAGRLSRVFSISPLSDKLQSEITLHTPFGLPRAVVTEEGQAVLDYSTLGQLSAASYPDGSGRVYAYDALGKLLSAVIDPGPNVGGVGRTTSFEYTANGRPLSVEIAPVGGDARRVDFEYSPAGRLIKQVSQGNELIEATGFAPSGEVDKLQLNGVVQLDVTRDAMSRITQVDASSLTSGILDSTVSFGPMDPGLVRVELDSIEVEIESAKGLDEVSETTHDLQTGAVLSSSSVNSAAPSSSVLEAESAGTPFSDLTIQRDLAGRVGSVQWVDPSTSTPGQIVAIDRSVSNTTLIEFAGGVGVRYTYDETANRLLTEAFGLGGNVVTRDTYYDARGAPVGLVDPDYEEFGCTPSLPATAFLYEGIDASLIAIIAGMPASALATYPNVQGASGGSVITLDENWNRTAIQSFGGAMFPQVTQYFSPVDDRLQSYNSYPVTHDALGSVASMAGVSATFDAFGKLRACQLGSATLSLDYDGLGRLVRLTEVPASGGSIETIYNWQGRVLIGSLTRESGITVAHWSVTYDGGMNRPIALRDELIGAEYLLVLDPSGSVRELIDASGGIAGVFGYGIDGRLLRIDDNRAGIPKSDLARFPLGYQCGVRIDEVGRLTQMGARVYDSATARFLQLDRLHYLDGIGNRYQKTSMNPFRKDRSGLSEQGTAQDGPERYTHAGYTRWACEQLSLPKDVTNALVFQVIRVDKDERKAGIGSPNNATFHMLGPEGDIASEKLQQLAVISGFTIDVGAALHAIQDNVFHRSPGGAPYLEAPGHMEDSITSNLWNRGDMTMQNGVRAFLVDGLQIESRMDIGLVGAMVGMIEGGPSGAMDNWNRLHNVGYDPDATEKTVADEWRSLLYQRGDVVRARSLLFLRQFDANRDHLQHKLYGGEARTTDPTTTFMEIGIKKVIPVEKLIASDWTPPPDSGFPAPGPSGGGGSAGKGAGAGGSGEPLLPPVGAGPTGRSDGPGVRGWSVHKNPVQVPPPSAPSSAPPPGPAGGPPDSAAPGESGWPDGWGPDPLGTGGSRGDDPLT